jgi:hypothetical protein
VLDCPAHELTEWELYERIHGELGPGRHDLSFAYLALIIANQYADKSKGPLIVSDFMPPHGKRRLSKTVIEKLRFRAELRAANPDAEGDDDLAELLELIESEYDEDLEGV